jgi:hypothetical protein
MFALIQSFIGPSNIRLLLIAIIKIAMLPKMLLLLSLLAALYCPSESLDPFK